MLDAFGDLVNASLLRRVGWSLRDILEVEIGLGPLLIQ